MLLGLNFLLALGLFLEGSEADFDGGYVGGNKFQLIPVNPNGLQLRYFPLYYVFHLVVQVINAHTSRKIFFRKVVDR